MEADTESHSPDSPSFSGRPGVWAELAGAEAECGLIVVVDGLVVHANRRAVEQTGHGAERTLPAERLHALFRREDSAAIDRLLDVRSAESADAGPVEVGCARPRTDSRTEADAVSMLRLWARRVEHDGVTAVVVTVQELVTSPGGIGWADCSIVDAPTQLPNRAAFLGGFDDALQRARRNGRPAGLLVMQIDQFRLANETFGYAGGDALLLAVGQRLARQGDGELLAHLGGGEFAASLHRLPLPAEASLQKRAQGWVRSLEDPFLVDGCEMFVTCSIGAALGPADGGTAALLLDRAQAAMRQAHAWGSNHVFFYTPEASARATARLARESALRHALARGELYVCYQPQIDLHSGRVIGVEALARWRDGVHGEVPPSEFIPLAEQIGLIVPIGEWVLRTACEDAVRWLAAGLPPVRVAVNLSMQQLELPDMAERVRIILQQTGLEPRCLGLEITESMLFDNVQTVARTLEELRRTGVEISLDDFGTGYSNLGYLSKLPIDVMKIDRAFVPDVTASAGDVSIARGMIRLAHSLKMQVLAEGVETLGQLAMLVASGCDQVQGYYFSRPVRPELIPAILQKGYTLPEELFGRQVTDERCVLVVDVDERHLEALRLQLRRSADKVLVAQDATAALRLLAENDVGVLVATLRLPDLPGLELMRRARALYPDTLRIATLQDGDAPSLADAVNEAALFRIVALPHELSRLHAHVEDAFRQRELVRDQLRAGNQMQSITGELTELRERVRGLLTV